MNSVNSINQRNIKPPRKDKKSKKTDLVKESDEPITVPITEAPEFMRDNCYIKTGYLVNCNSVTKAVKGMTFIHDFEKHFIIKEIFKRELLSEKRWSSCCGPRGLRI